MAADFVSGTAEITADEVKDLGFGSKVTQQAGARFLNRDGSFNVRRYGLSRLQSISMFHSMLTISWLRFYSIVVAGYFAVNLLFASAYYVCGPQALQISSDYFHPHHFVECFFFSIQTFTTIGYGRVAPVGIAANILVSIEALAGLLGFAFATGLSFARFSRPAARIIFSKNAIVAPYRGGRAFEFRIINARKSQLIEVDIKVFLSRLERRGSDVTRRFHELELERQHVSFFPLNWTVVHPLNSKSPLNEVTPQSLLDSEAEFLILLTGIEETFAQQVHSRSSYKAHEVVFDHRFADMYLKTPDGTLAVDIELLHEIEPASAT